MNALRKKSHLKFLYEPVLNKPDPLRVGWLYPADENIALSSLGYMALFRQLDENPNVHVTLITEDTLNQYTASDFDCIGISFSFELDILNILKSLEALEILLSSQDRDARYPLIFAGGPVPTTNPEPYADFFDFFIIGDGEDTLNQLVEAQLKTDWTKEEQLKHFTQSIPGLYAPSLYEVTYNPDQTIQAITPKYDDIPFPVQKAMRMDPSSQIATTPILSETSFFASTFLIEVMRGCAHRCRFCLASYSTLPAQGPSLEAIQEKIDFGIQHNHKIGLLGALIADHPHFPELCAYINHIIEHQKPDLVVSSASLRGDTLTPDIAKTFKNGKQKQLTIAVESGSQKLRRRINKNLKHQDILNAAASVYKAGIPGLKLYGMVGLPDETEEDIEALGNLMKELKETFPKLKLTLGCSSFVPKAATPFQWQPRLPNKMIDQRFEMLRKTLANRGKKLADFRPSSANWDMIQGVLSRGDRRLAPLLVRFKELGGSVGSLKRAYKELQKEGHHIPPLEWYALRERGASEILPWEMLHLGVPKNILYKEGLPPISVI